MYTHVHSMCTLCTLDEHKLIKHELIELNSNFIVEL